MKKLLPILVLAVIVIAGGAFYFARQHTHNSASTNINGSSSSMMNMPNNPQNSSNTSPQATDKVSIQNFAFSPATITVKKGTTVTWTNQDSAAHTVTETDGKAGPNSGNLTQGQSYTFTYDMAGTFSYHCSIHPGMTGTVTVTE